MSLPDSTTDLSRPGGAALLRDEGRYHALDSLRASAMFLGIILHAALSFTVLLPVEWAAQDARGHWSFDLVVSLIHGFRMQLFFFLAGFFGRMLQERLGPTAFFKHRLKRIGLPFAVGMLVLIPLTLGIWIWGVSRMPASPSLSLEQGGFSVPTMHLWFLQFLLLHYAAAWCAVAVFRWVPRNIWEKLDRAFDLLLPSPWKLLLLASLTVLCLWPGPIWGEAHLAGTRFVPEIHAVAYYGLFFAAGWWLHRRRDRMGELKNRVKSGFLAAFAVMALNGFILGSQPSLSEPNQFWLKTASLACAAFYAWLMVFGVTGLFLRFAEQPRMWVRYLADASYWCYLAHLPIVVFLQIIIAPWAFAAWAKFMLVVAITMLLLLASYELWIRYTFVGAILNGPRKPLEKAQHARAVHP